MPIYEEKLICPLSVRFTQEHIRPIFQEGHDMEKTIEQIRARPGAQTSEYDVILEAPFPKIEVIRWYQEDDEEGVEEDATHWFTLDNRRLYCLQRAAAAHWPQRVAVVVEALYAPTDGMRRKDDSSTVGRSVGIGHSLKHLTGRWDWRLAVAPHEAAMELVSDDDAKADVEELADAPAPPSMMDLFLQGEAVVKNDTLPDGHSEKSTANPTSPRSLDSSEESSPASGKRCAKGPSQARPQSQSQAGGAPNNLRRLLSGTWWGKDDTYEIEFESKDFWTCVRTDSSGSRKTFSLWLDQSSDAVWWGNKWSIYLDLSEARGDSACMRWRDAADDGYGKPRFAWRRPDAQASMDEASAAAGAGKAAPARQGKSAASGKAPRRMWAPARRAY